MTGAVLLVLFIAECLTLLNLGNMLTLHVFLGFLLLGPVSLKIASTLWRFTRYYTGSVPYVKKGPRAPLVIATIRGLLLDLLATGDRDRVQDAAESFLATLEHRADPPGPHGPAELSTFPRKCRGRTSGTSPAPPVSRRV